MLIVAERADIESSQPAREPDAAAAGARSGNRERVRSRSSSHHLARMIGTSALVAATAVPAHEPQLDRHEPESAANRERRVEQRWLVE